MAETIPQLPPQEMWPTRDLFPSEKNPRTHTDKQIDHLVRLIRKFGFTNPVICVGSGERRGEIIAGHGRHRAAVMLGLKEIPVIPVDGWTEEMVLAYMIADNQSALQSGWDKKQLAADLHELRDFQFDLTLLGFERDELAKRLGEAIDESSRRKGSTKFVKRCPECGAEFT